MNSILPKKIDLHTSRVNTPYEVFLKGKKQLKNQFTFVSLFSGAGVGDFGLKKSGGICLAACEIDPHRRHVHYANLKAPIFGNIREEKDLLIKHLKGTQPDLVIATPPCQSFSTANARRGLREDPLHASRDERNNLFFEALYIIRNAQPKIVIFENVPNFLERRIHSNGGNVTGKVIDFLNASLTEYVSISQVVCLSVFGVPQRRKRSLVIFVRKDAFHNPYMILDQLNPYNSNWSKLVKGTPTNLIDAIGHLPILDSKSHELAQSDSDIFHHVPVMDKRRYNWISSIRKNSGNSAWLNACQNCGNEDTAIFSIDCIQCGSKILSRPHVLNEDGTIRIIKGFKTSYKRMLPYELAPTITTNTNSFSSDNKIHPNQNRVLSVRESALLQTIPYSFEWTKDQHFKSMHLIREMIGEAVPTLVTYKIGKIIAKLLNG